MDVINAAISIYHSEVSGQLNEHNFSAHALEDSVDPPIPDPPEHVEMGFACTIHHTEEEADPYAGPFQEIKKSSSWHPVHGGLLEFDTSGGNVHIVASWQMGISDAAITTPGLMYAFEVDGNVLPDAMVGSGDLGNDMVDVGIELVTPITVNTWATGPGIANRDTGVVLELITYMAPGRHIVRLMSKWLSVNNDDAQQSFSTSVRMYAVDMRDL